MTNPPTFPEPSPQPAPQLGPPMPPVKKKSKLPWIIGGAALVVLLCFGGCAAVLVAAGDAADEGKKVAQSATPTPKAGAAAAPATSAAAPSYSTPKSSDFKLKVKMLDKQCFGSAGCNVEFRVSEVTYVGAGLDPDATYEISYEFKGLEDPMIGTFELSGDGSYSIEDREFGMTRRSSDKVKAEVTDVEKVS
ncbi:hypothetical protein [Micromonospora andamanensis]|uniref:hypothetical protein n=1 Tax=Micromonospora andamanensis TaxID=1287068 RepID=UPI001951A0B5|nr:hypothetical protein [Micromonospora andamanensis]